MLSFDAVRRSYGAVTALVDLTVDVPAGEVFGLLGPNGAGKTTAMRIAMGLLAADHGTVRLHGRPLDEQAWLRFGYLPEERGLYPSMTVTDHLVYLGRVRGMARDAACRSACEWLDRLDLIDRRNSKISSLSLGNQQRVQLVAALIHQPDVLILDEPFSGLDPIGIETMGLALNEVASAGAVVVVSSHQLDLVEERCRSVAILDGGRLVLSGRVADLTTTREAVFIEVGGRRRWRPSISGVHVDEANSTGRRLRLTLSGRIDPQRVLADAQEHGPVTHFSMARRRLSEVFLEAVTA